MKITDVEVIILEQPQEYAAPTGSEEAAGGEEIEAVLDSGADLKTSLGSLFAALKKDEKR